MSRRTLLQKKMHRHVYYLGRGGLVFESRDSCFWFFFGHLHFSALRCVLQPYSTLLSSLQIFSGPVSSSHLSSSLLSFSQLSASLVALRSSHSLQHFADLFNSSKLCSLLLKFFSSILLFGHFRTKKWLS